MHREKRFRCNKCPKSFATKSLLNRHKATHNTENLYPCYVSNCTKSFKTENYLALHTLRMHAEKRFRCDECPKSFSAIHLLHDHKVSHNTEKPYSCNVPNCSYSSKWKHNLNIHKRLKHTEKHFRCDLCPKRYATERLLNKHKVSHNTVRKFYSCDEPNCSKSYQRKNALYKHKRLMHKEKHF